MFHQLLMDLLYAILYGVIIWAVQALSRTAIPLIKMRLAEGEYAWAATIIENAVRAFEQTMSGSGRGEEKYEVVLEHVTHELHKLGITLTESQISTLIEAAVQTMNAEKIDLDIPEPEVTPVINVTKVDDTTTVESHYE